MKDENQKIKTIAEINVNTYMYWNFLGIGCSVCMMFYVILKFIYNANAEIELQIDLWS